LRRIAPCLASSHTDLAIQRWRDSVSPYGCSHFDGRQTKEEADLRSGAGHYHVDLAWKNDHLYARLWLLLKTLGRVAPAPVVSRARMRAALATGKRCGEDCSTSVRR